MANTATLNRLQVAWRQTAVGFYGRFSGNATDNLCHTTTLLKPGKVHDIEFGVYIIVCNYIYLYRSIYIYYICLSCICTSACCIHISTSSYKLQLFLKQQDRKHLHQSNPPLESPRPQGASTFGGESMEVGLYKGQIPTHGQREEDKTKPLLSTDSEGISKNFR